MRRASDVYPAWDGARPHYFVEQFRIDLRDALGKVIRITVLAAQGVGLLLVAGGGTALILCVPLLTIPLAILPVFVVGALLCWLATAVVVSCTAGIAWVVGSAATGLLRAVDAAVVRARQAQPTCPGCGWTTAVPAFRCSNPNCGVAHRDVRPGRLGVWWHRCLCGRRLPTTTIRAGTRLKAECPYCHGPLLKGSTLVPNARIAVSGSRAVRTNFLMAGLPPLTEPLEADSGWRPTDLVSATWLAGASALRTVSATRPVISLERPGGLAFLHILTEPPALATGHVLVVDLSEFSQVEGRAGGHRSMFAMDHWHPSVEAVRTTYEAMIGQITDVGGRADRRDLAFVITRADLVTGLGFGLGEPSSAAMSGRLRAWLDEAGLHNVIMTAELDFRQVRYFLVGPGHGPELPFVWLLGQQSKPVFRPCQARPDFS